MQLRFNLVQSSPVQSVITDSQNAGKLNCGLDHGPWTVINFALQLPNWPMDVIEHVGGKFLYPWGWSAGNIFIVLPVRCPILLLS